MGAGWWVLLYMSAIEQHFKPIQLAKLWGVSDETIRRIFENEPGVLVIDRPEELHKRGYRSVRIPSSVAERVHKQYLSR